MEILSNSVFKGQVRFNEPVDFDESEFHFGQAFFNSSTTIDQLNVRNVSGAGAGISFNSVEHHNYSVSFHEDVYMNSGLDVSGPLEVCGSEIHSGPGSVWFCSSGYDFEINNMRFSVKNGSADLLGNDFTCVGIVNRSQSNWTITHGSYTNAFPQKSGTLATVDDIPTIPTLGVQLSHTQLKLDASTIPADCTAFSFGSYPTRSDTLNSSSPADYIVSTQAYLLDKDGTSPITYPAIEIELVCGVTVGKKASGLSLEGTLGVNILSIV